MTDKERKPRRLSTVILKLREGAITEREARLELARGGWNRHDIDFWMKVVLTDD